MFRRLLACTRGASAVEAALVYPILILLVLGIIEFALLLFTYSAMQSAARDVTRQIAVNFTGEGQAAAAVANRVPGWARGGMSVAVTQSDPGDPENNIIGIDLSLPAAQATPLRFFTAGGGWDLQTRVEMKQELPFVMQQ